MAQKVKAKLDMLRFQILRNIYFALPLLTSPVQIGEWCYKTSAMDYIRGIMQGHIVDVFITIGKGAHYIPVVLEVCK